MTWLVIIFAVAVVLSPLMWFKQSPRQRRVSHLRSVAATFNLQVALHRRPEAREGEDALSCVCYKMRCQHKIPFTEWVIHRFSQRGWSSDWEGWQWFKQQADDSWSEILGNALQDMPDGVTAAMMQKSSVGVIWDERGDEENLEQIAKNLLRLKHHVENNC